MLDGTVVNLVLFGAFGYLFYLYLTWNYKYWAKRGVVGPKAKVVSGTYPSTLSADNNLVIDMCSANKMFKKTENFVGMYSFRQPQLLLLSPCTIKEVLTDKFNSFHDNDISRNVDEEVDDVLSKSPSFSKGDDWKRSRSEIEDAFRYKTVEQIYPQIVKASGKLVTFLEERSQYPPISGINAKDFALKFTSQVISQCIFGLEPKNFDEEELSEFYKTISSPISQSIITCLYRFLPPLLQFRNIPYLPESTKEFLKDIVLKSMMKRKEHQSQPESQFTDFLLKLKEEKKLTPAELSSHAITFMLDGFETCATAISHTLLLLGRHPNYQDKLRYEIQRYQVQGDGHLSFDSLMEMEYLDNCVNECLRIFPPILYSSKVCTEDCELMNKNEQSLIVEAGCNVVIPIYAIHHDEDFFRNPENYNPDRFSDARGGCLQKYIDDGIFLPFGMGPRKCLGMQYSHSIVKAAIVEIVKNFKIKTNSNTRIDNQIDGTSFIANLKGGIWLDFEMIKKTT